MTTPEKIKATLIGFGVLGGIVIGAIPGDDSCTQDQIDNETHIQMSIDGYSVCIENDKQNIKATLKADFESDKRLLPLGKKYDFDIMNKPLLEKIIKEDILDVGNIEGGITKETILNLFNNQ